MNVLIEENCLANTAEAIRRKNGQTTKYTASEFEAAINGISTDVVEGAATDMTGLIYGKDTKVNAIAFGASGKILKMGAAGLPVWADESVTPVDTTIVSGGTNAVSSGAVYTALAGKADASALPKWDTTPTNGSSNGITSGGVYAALAGKADASSIPVMPSFDATPTSGSSNGVTSGGVYTALTGKADSGHSHALTGSSITGTLPISKGGTGQTSATAAFNALAASGTVKMGANMLFTLSTDTPGVTYANVNRTTGQLELKFRSVSIPLMEANTVDGSPNILGVYISPNAPFEFVDGMRIRVRANVGATASNIDTLRFYTSETAYTDVALDYGYTVNKIGPATMGTGGYMCQNWIMPNQVTDFVYDQRVGKFVPPVMQAATFASHAHIADLANGYQAVVPIDKGGTGQTTAALAFNAIAASGGTMGGILTLGSSSNITKSGHLGINATGADHDLILRAVNGYVALNATHADTGVVVYSAEGLALTTSDTTSARSLIFSKGTTNSGAASADNTIGKIETTVAGVMNINATSLNLNPATVNICGNLRLKNNTNFGCKLNFGDSEYVYLYEDIDDHLMIHAGGGTKFDGNVEVAGTLTAGTFSPGSLTVPGAINMMGPNLVFAGVASTVERGIIWSNVAAASVAHTDSNLVARLSANSTAMRLYSSLPLTISASSLTFSPAIPIASGGTGQTTAAAAFNALAGSQVGFGASVNICGPRLNLGSGVGATTTTVFRINAYTNAYINANTSLAGSYLALCANDTGGIAVYQTLAIYGASSANRKLIFANMTTPASAVGGSYSAAYLDANYAGALTIHTSGGLYVDGPGTSINATNGVASTVAIGSSSPVNANSKTYAVCIGYGATLNGNESVAIGDVANAGAYGIAIGYGACTAAIANGIAFGRSAQSLGANGIAIGYCVRAAGTRSVAIATNANATGGDSVAIGHNAITTGANGVAIGIKATACTNSVAIGTNTTAYSTDSAVIGALSSIPVGANYALVLGYAASVAAIANYSTAIGAYAYATGPSSMFLGNSSYCSYIYCCVAPAWPSDIRDKTDVTPIDDSLGFLSRLHPFTYVDNYRTSYQEKEEFQWVQVDTGRVDEDGNPIYETRRVSNLTDEDKELREATGIGLYDHVAHAAGTKKGDELKFGVSAQEVNDVLNDIYGSARKTHMVVDTLRDKDPSSVPENAENQLTVTYSEFIPILIDAVNKLNAQVQDYKSQVDYLLAQLGHVDN